LTVLAVFKRIIHTINNMAELQTNKSSFVYKKIGDLELLTDVYHPNPLYQEQYPVIIHFHGGGLIVGDRNLQDPDFIPEALQSNWIYITFDYRLAPEVKIVDIWSDCTDHWNWVFQELPKLLHVKLDHQRVGAMGESAGGYLTLLAGYKPLHPRPVAIAEFYGINGVDSDYFNKPKENIPTEAVVPESVMELVEAKPLSGAPWLTADFKPTPRSSIWSYLIQKGLYGKSVFGFDVNKSEELEKLIEWKPTKNITRDYPPTIVLHGNKDTIVPFQDAEEVVESLKKAGVDHQFIIGEGEGHGFFYRKPDPKYQELN